MSDQLKVTMLGGFSIRLGDQVVDDNSNRMRKVWLLLACLIHSRNTAVTQDHFLCVLRSSGAEESSDPNGRLKAMFYRARTMLNQLSDGLGHTLITHQGGSYAWNTQFPLELDTEEFEHLCSAAAADPDEDSALAHYLQALELYRGDFLPKLSMEAWVIPLNAYYHRMYLEAAQQALTLLEARERWEQAAELCRRALIIEPYSESLYQHRMRCAIALGDRAGAMSAYDEMSELLFATFGVMPSEDSRQLYRQAGREPGSHSVPVSEVRDQLREIPGAKGALFCEYDFFRLLYQVQARSIVRSGDTIHIALLSVHPRGKKELARRSMDRAVENLQELMLLNLRQGDVVTRCSVTQLIVMLPQANYENSCMVCQRILRAFNRQYPHSPVEIRYSVQPLEPRETLQ